MFNRLFTPISLTEADDTGLVSPYSVSRQEVNALAIDELETETRKIGYVITNTYKKCSSCINLIKRVDLEGFLTFKSRIKETMELNAILDGNDALQDQVAEIFAWAYVETSKNNKFLIYSDTNTAKKVAFAVYSKAQSAGLKFPPGKISNLFQSILTTVFTKLDHSKKK